MDGDIVSCMDAVHGKWSIDQVESLGLNNETLTELDDVNERRPLCSNAMALDQVS